MQDVGADQTKAERAVNVRRKGQHVLGALFLVHISSLGKRGGSGSLIQDKLQGL